MHIAVLLRQVPDLAEEIEVAESQTDIDRDWVATKLNEFDDHALEEAILLKERNGASVTALMFGGEDADKVLRAAMARGADHVAKIATDLPSYASARAVAAIVADVIRSMNVDLVLTGVQTAEDVTGQLAPWLGVELNWVHVSAVAGLSADASNLHVRQEHSGGYATELSLTLPAALGIQSASAPPRYVSGSKLRQVMNVSPDVITPHSPVETAAAPITSLEKAQTAATAEMWDDDAEAAAESFIALLKDRGLLEGQPS